MARTANTNANRGIRGNRGGGRVVGAAARAQMRAAANKRVKNINRRKSNGGQGG